MTAIRDQYTAQNGHTYTYTGFLVMHGETATIQNLRVVDENGRPANIKLADIAHAVEGSPEQKAHLSIHQGLDHLA
jgi:hypothetical protein